MQFEEYTDEQFRIGFISMIKKGSKNNTYKFALARFLLDHSNGSGAEKVRYANIAEEFFNYYWFQECKFKLRQGPDNQTPEIITIIRKKFRKDAYPEMEIKELRNKEPGKIENCVTQITKKCFDDVIPRFQKIGRNEKRMFYIYLAKEYKDSSDNKKIDPKGGILLNPRAMIYLKRNYVPLYNTVILEWIRFLERRNFGTPHLSSKIEGIAAGSRDQGKFRNDLKSFMAEGCFYCKKDLKKDKNTHIDHFIPFDYIADTELWNLVLSCQKCNCKKLGQLPPSHYIDKLLERNDEFKKKNKTMKKSLVNLNYGGHDICWHYQNAKLHGYPIWEKFVENKRSARCESV